jgi:hypothetical protein
VAGNGTLNHGLQAPERQGRDFAADSTGPAGRTPGQRPTFVRGARHWHFVTDGDSSTVARHAISALCADVGSVPIKTKAVQIWGFCALRRRRVVSRGGEIELIGRRGGLPSPGPVPGDGPRHRIAVRGGLEVAEGGFEFAGVDDERREELVGRLA